MEKSYSSTPLVKKLGIKEGMTIAVLHAPSDYFTTLVNLPNNVKVKEDIAPNLDFVHFFTQSQESLRGMFPKLKDAIINNGMVWVSWPKGACNIRTDLNDNIVRNIGLTNGLVDVKVCSINDTWSAIKFVYRLKDR